MSKYSLKMHKTSCHDKIVEPDQGLQLINGPVLFKHPFTCTISGSSKCGKTAFLLKMLQSDTIQPQADRIVILYKRWQPLYDNFKSFLPKAEFYKGIPRNLDDDKFFDVRKRNLIVLDDLMSDTSKDNCVSELFTEGSHHRNLSVVNLTQNLFPPGKQSTTQRRNTQYLVLFKSPMGQDQIQTMGKFMFPGRVKSFMKIYENATRKPYGHLVIDTNESYGNRLKTDVFNELPKDPPIEYPMSLQEKERTPIKKRLHCRKQLS